MKQNYTLKQYIQLAKEQFCHIMKNIPFVSDIEIIDIAFQCGFGNFHAIVHYNDTGGSQRFCIKVESIGEKRFVNAFMLTASQKHDTSCYVFSAPFLSEASAQALIDHQYSFMDLSGNCYIYANRIFLHYQGRTNQYIVPREKRNLFSKSSTAASAVLRTMLDRPCAYWNVSVLSELSGKSIGTVSNVKRFLLDHAWIEEFPHGFQLKNIKELLHTWAQDYHKTKAITREYYSLDPIAEIESKISEWSRMHGHLALLSGFSAAARYAPTVRYSQVSVYVEQQMYDQFVMDLELKSVEYGGNVAVTIPHDETPRMFFREINDDFITSPVQTIIDLSTNSNRGEEAADAIILKEYKE